MPSYETQVTLWPTTNLNADVSTNTWSCVADNLAGQNDFYTALIAFYQSVRPDLSGLIRQTNNRVKTYDRADAIPRAPVGDTGWNFVTAPAGGALPTEVALVMSFQGDRLSGVNQARRRGRVYLGPLNTGSTATTGRPAAATLSRFVAAGQTLLDASQAATNWDWTVHSTVTGTDVVVTNGWVDDEFDTQRRRGRLPTTRTTFV